MIPTSDPIIHGYRTPKRGEAQVTCQDFWIRNLSLKPVAEAKPMPRRPQWTEPWAGTLHRIRLGIADGASTTFCAGMWAEALSAAAAESQEAWNNPARFNGMLAGLRNIWRTQVLRTLPDPLPWNVETALNNGAWSTVLRVTVLRRKWEAEGWGDSCLFHLRRGHRLRMVPHLLPRDFFQLVVVDEAHHTTAGTWAKVIEHFHSAKLLGVTATPIRGDGRGLGEHYQCMVEGPTAQQLTDAGFLAAAKVLAPPGFDSTGLRKRMGDFDPRQAEQRVGTIMGDCLGHYLRHLPGQTAIAFCCSVAHAEAVAALFQSAGIAAASIDGTMDATTRRELLQRLAAGDLKVLTSCALIGEGVDVPSVGGCILLRPTASVGLHLQMIGRCLRPQPGKRAVVLDHVGNTLRLGHHLEAREWTLDGIKKRDREAAPSVKVCPVCFAANPSGAQVCIECRHEFRSEVRELQVVEGELVEMTARERKREQGKATDLEALRELAQQRGYKRGWAERVHQARLAKRHGI